MADLDSLVTVWPLPALVATIIATIVTLTRGADRLVANAVDLSFRWAFHGS